jgi:hypothetical protein
VVPVKGVFTSAHPNPFILPLHCVCSPGNKVSVPNLWKCYDKGKLDIQYTMSNATNGEGPHAALASTTSLPTEPEGPAHAPPSVTTPKFRPSTDQHRHSPTKFSRFLQRVNDWWVLEATGLLISIGAAGAAVGVLRLYNGRPLQEWRYHLGINTVISFLAITSKSSLALVVEGCLGQLKWIWYSVPRKRHSLIDFQTFDGASRGPYGAAQLLLTLQEIDISLVGAFVMLCALVYEPFIQQTISTPLLSSSLSTNSSLPIATTYAAYDFGGLQSGVINIELPMKAAIYDGIFYQNVSTTATAISPTCSTGNCTFEQYSSLFVCSRCVNVTSLIKSTCTSGSLSTSSPYCVYALPNGLNATGDHSLLQTSTGALSTTEFDNAGPVISNFSSIIFSDNDPVVSALDCILYFCAKIYHSSVVRGAFHETTEATVHADSVQNDDSGLGGSNLTVTVPPSLLSSAKRETFVVQEATADALTIYLQQLLAGEAHTQDYVLFGSPVVGYSTDVIQALYTNNDINQTMTNLATAMGNHIRLKGASYASGTTDAMVTFIHVRWLWLILPFSLEALTLVTLIGTIILSAVRTVPIWKSSALAPMFHGVHVDITKSARVENTEEMETFAEHSQAVLVTEKGRTVLKSTPNFHDAKL